MAMISPSERILVLSSGDLLESPIGLFAVVLTRSLANASAIRSEAHHAHIGPWSEACLSIDELLTDGLVADIAFGWI